MSSQLWLSFGWQSYIPQNLCRISSPLLCPVCDTIWLVPVRLWQMVKWLGSSAQQLWAELPQTPGPVFEASIQHMKQFAHSWYSHCYQYTDTRSHVSSIRKYSFEDSTGVESGLVWFSFWLGIKQTPSHHLNQSWPSSIGHHQTQSRSLCRI